MDALTAQANDLVNTAAALAASTKDALADPVSAVTTSASLVLHSAGALAQAALGLSAQAPSAAGPLAADGPGQATPAAPVAPDRQMTARAPQASAPSIPSRPVPAAASVPALPDVPVAVNATGPGIAPQPTAPAARVEGAPDPATPSHGAYRASRPHGAANRPSAAEPTTSPSEDPNAGESDPTPLDPCQPGEPAGYATSAAAKYGWGKPNRVEDFDGSLDKSWGLYDGPGHEGKGRRTPDAVTLANGVMTITGDPNGNTEGMAWNPGQKYGRWEGRVKAPASDRSYNALLLLWPDAENWPVGGEVDFMEMSDHTRQSTDMFLHYGRSNSQLQGNVKIDATQWHNWAVEWTPDHIAAFVDGKQWWRTDNAKALPPGPMHLCIQLDWFPRGGSVQTSHMYVDWVRQYPLAAGDKSSSEGTAVSTRPGRVRAAVPAP